MGADRSWYETCLARRQMDPNSDLERATEALRRVIDPEVGINVVDLGLVYGVEVDESRVVVTMTMTSPACPLGDMIQSQAERAIELALPGRSVEIELVWHPPWTRDRMSSAAKQMLGFGD